MSSESNEVCSREDKRTIAPEHVLKALEVFYPMLYFTFFLKLCLFVYMLCVLFCTFLVGYHKKTIIIHVVSFTLFMDMMNMETCSYTKKVCQ